MQSRTSQPREAAKRYATYFKSTLKKNEIYRIKKGQLTNLEHLITIDFGIVYAVKDEIFVDLYTNESFDLNNLISEQYKSKKLDDRFTLNSLTEDNYELNLYGLDFRNIKPSKCKIIMECKDFINLKINNSRIPENNEQDYIQCIILEGLNMEFNSWSKKSISRENKVLPFSNSERDYTKVCWKVNTISYNLIFEKLDKSKNIRVIFEAPNRMLYSDFMQNKLNFIYLLSLVNGAEVRVRKEFYSSMTSNNHKLYSFSTIKNLRHNYYLPIKEYFKPENNILDIILSECFNNYQVWEERLSLNSIIFYLSNSEQTKGIEEAVFIRIIAFEKLTSMYANHLEINEEFCPSKEEFEPIKNEILEIIENHKSKFGNYYNDIKGKISNLNQIKRKSTIPKMYKIITDLEIPICEKIETLIDKVRHKTVHFGDINFEEDRFLYFQLVDELIREIILRLIEYNGPRNNEVIQK